MSGQARPTCPVLGSVRTPSISYVAYCLSIAYTWAQTCTQTRVLPSLPTTHTTYTLWAFQLENTEEMAWLNANVFGVILVCFCFELCVAKITALIEWIYIGAIQCTYNSWIWGLIRLIILDCVPTQILHIQPISGHLTLQESCFLPWLHFTIMWHKNRNTFY